jgi:hypothetical protein
MSDIGRCAMMIVGLLLGIALLLLCCSCRYGTCQFRRACADKTIVVLLVACWWLFVDSFFVSLVRVWKYCRTVHHGPDVMPVRFRQEILGSVHRISKMYQMRFLL